MVTASPPKTASPNNRFDALRLLFASLVVIGHLTLLPDLHRGTPFETFGARLAEYAVRGFFVISGALVYGSFLRSASLSDYAEKRIRRLAPAYTAIILIPTLIASLLIISLGQWRDFANIAQYFAANMIFLNFLHPELPGLFAGHRFQAVNGSLWTIKIEVMFYAALPVIAFMLGRFKPAGSLALLGILYIAGEAWRMVFEHLYVTENRYFWLQVALQLPGQIAYFACGMALWIYRHHVKKHLSLWGALGLSLFIACESLGLAFLLPAALTGLIAFAAWAPGPVLNATRWGDLSYGVYIVHYPIIQTLIAFGLFEQNYVAACALTIALVIISALAMWRFVERPFLRQDSHYRRSEIS
ncbi:MAG: acyltransferase [Pseudomonadota bacterium]